MACFRLQRVVEILGPLRLETRQGNFGSLEMDTDSDDEHGIFDVDDDEYADALTAALEDASLV